MIKSRHPHVVVFFGGEAANRDLSNETGYWVCQYMPREKYDVTPVHVCADGKWQVPLGSLPRSGSVEKMMDYLYRGLKALSPTAALERLVARPISAFLSLLRGPGGDDGGLHSMGRLLDIRVVGSPALTCQQTHNKRLSYAILRDLASVPEAACYGQNESPENIATDVRESLAPPLFVKPVTQEGSAGIEHVRSQEELLGALERALRFGEIIVQEAAQGTEFTLSLVDQGQKKALLLPPTMVVPQHTSYYDSLAKRRPGRVALHTTSFDNNVLILEAEAIAREVYEQLGCRGYASMDFVANDSSVDLLEVNTVPVLSAATPFIHQLSAGKVYPTAFLESLLKSSI